MAENRRVRILIATDKFKGSLTAAQAARAVEQALERGWPDIECDVCPIADGGEGTTEAMITAMHGSWMTAAASDAHGRPIEARYGWVADRNEAILEMSAASGLALVSDLPPAPATASTWGTGLLIQDAVRHGARRILIGIGGSATNDGGIGMAAALGYRFLDRSGRTLRPTMTEIDRTDRIERPATDYPQILVACDVTNPLLGEQGASAVYGPQKGVRDVAWFEARLQRLADLVARDLGVDPRDVPGAGAAGGLGFGLLAFCGARLTSGFDLVAQQVELEPRIRRADLVITGEGRIDSQTLHGKGPAGVAGMAQAFGKPVAAFAGSVEDSPALRERFDLVRAITPPAMPLSEAMKRAESLLETAVTSVLAELTELAAAGGRR